MQFLIDIVTLALACFLAAVIAAPPATPSCVPDSKVLGNLTKPFTLRVLFRDDRGQIDLKDSKPVVFGSYETVSGAMSTPLIVGSAKAQPEVFTLKDNTLFSSTGEGFSFENPSYNPRWDGPQTLVIDSLGRPASYSFTAVQACDRNGRGFLRLGQNRGEFIITESSK